MLRIARFAFLVGFGAAIPAVVALNPPESQNKQNKKDISKKAESSKISPSSKDDADQRIDRRDSRMRERDREIDRMLNKQKK